MTSCPSAGGEREHWGMIQDSRDDKLAGGVARQPACRWQILRTSAVTSGESDELSESADLSAGTGPSYRSLKRYLSIPRALILESRVWRGMPSLAAAPDGPAIRPPDRADAASISSRSRAATM